MIRIPDPWFAVARRVDPLRPFLDQPFTVVLDGEAWNFATDGWRLLAERGDGFELVPTEFPERLFVEAMALIPKETPTVSLAALRAWALDKLPPLRCLTCGAARHHRRKRWCKAGDPVTADDARAPGRIGAVVLNRRFVADWIERVGGTTVQVGSVENHLVFFVGDGWRATIVPLRGRAGVSGPSFVLEHGTRARDVA